MSYKRESHHILAGSLSYLPPADQISEGDALALTNFRSDQLGSLRSRLGHTSLYTGHGVVRSIIKALGHRYDASTTLYMDNASHATGFSGEPMGMVDYKKWLFVMDQTKQGKSDGTNFRLWSIVAPAAAATVAPATEVAKSIVGFESGESWAVDPAGSDSYNTTDEQDGTDCLEIAAPDESTFTLSATVSLDLSAYTGPVAASDDDKQRIWIFCNKFKRINAVTLDIDVNGGSYDDYYTVTIPRKKLKAAGKGWFHFEVRKRQPVDSGTGLPITDKKDLPFFTRIGATAGKNWATVAAVRIKLDVRAACTVRFDLWEMYGSINGTIEGQDIQYYYTFVNTQGHESNPSPASAKMAFDRTGASLTSLAVSADPQVTGKHIYRTGGTLGAVYRVTSTPITNATTTYTDVSSDDDIRRLGIQMATDNDAPPAAAGLVGPYYGRLIAFQTSANKNRFFWTKQNQPFAFPGAALDAGFWNDIGDTNEKIVAATMRPAMVVFYKENTIWRLLGDPGDTDGDVHITRATLGLIGAAAVCMAGEVDYFQALDGVYAFNGDTARKISQKLDPIFRGQTTTLASGVTVLPVSSSARDKSVLAYINGRLKFAYAEEGQSTPNTCLEYDANTQNWVRDSRAFTALYYEGQNGALLAGTAAGGVLILESGATDAGAAMGVDYQTKYYDFGAPDSDKTHEDCTLEFDSGGATLTVTAYLNNGATSVALGTVAGSGRTRAVLQFNSGQGVKARNISIRVTGSVSAAVVIYSATLNYYLEARQAKSFDTDEVPLGSGKMALVREIQLDLDNAATVGLTLLSDQPGEAMTSRATPTFAISTTRRMAHTVFASDFGGFLHRVVLSGADFRLYGGRALVQVVGTFLLGAKGEFWLSDTVDFGTERVKLIKEVEVVYSTLGTASLRIESDLPGGTSAQISGSPYNLSATVGEETRKIRLKGITKGRLYRFKVTPTADFRLEAIRVYLKSIGAPNASAWTWVSLPVTPTQDAQWLQLPFPIDEAA